jgi:hypothetical protein
MSKLFRKKNGNKDGDMMKRKSFGKLAIVTVLATLMLFGLCVCSKKADTSTTTTTTAATTTTTPAATTTTTTAEKTTTTTTTATTTAKVEEPVAETKVEEPVVEAKVEEPVVETKVEEPVAEVKVEEPVVVEETAAAAEEVPAFSAIFSYKGVTSNIVAYKDHASITIPEGVTADDISSIATLLLVLYPEAEKVTYSIQDGTLYLTYPEQAAEFIQTAIATLDSEAKWYIDEVTEAKEVEETVEAVVAAVEDVVENTELTIADDGTITCTYNYHDLATAKVVMGNEKTTITYPAEYIYKSDIEAFISALVEAYPSLAEHVTYAIPEDGTLEIYYPAEYVGGTYYKLETLAYADEAVTAYADAMLGELLAELEESLNELNDALEAVVAEEAAEAETPVFSTIFTYKGVTSDIYAYSDYAVLSVPEGVTEEDIAALAEMLVAAYPEAEAVQYLLVDDALILFYPAQSDEFIQAAVAQLESDAMYVIDLITADEVEEVAVAKVEEEAVVEAAVEEVPVFSTIFTYRGITSNVVAYSDHATLTIPEGTTEADIASCAAMLVEAYPEASLVQYKVADGTLTLYYPAQSDDLILVACSTLESEAKYLIDAVYASMAKTETAVAAVPAAETAVVEAAPAASAEEPVVIAAPAPAAEPVAAKESFIKGYSVGGVFEAGYNFNATKHFNYAGGLRGELVFSDKWAAGLEFTYNIKYQYLHADAYAKFTFAEFGNFKVYGAAGVGLDYSIKGNKVGLTLNGAVGTDYEISENWSVFGEIGYQYSFLTKSHDLSLSAGVKYTF